MMVSFSSSSASNARLLSPLLLLLLLLLLATAPLPSLAEQARDAVLRPVARPFAPADILGTYSRYLALPGSEKLCPTSIQHIAYQTSPASGGSPTYAIRHQDIKHDNVQCTDSGNTTVADPKVLLADPNVNATLGRDPSGYVAGALANLLSNTSSLGGFDSTPRECGSAVGTPAGAAWFLVHENHSVTLVPNVAVLPPGPRYIVLFALPPAGSNANFIGCVYNATSKASSGTASPNATTSSTNGSACFPASAIVTLKSGATKTMDEVAVGDVVAVGPFSYSTVFGFTHQDIDARSSFVRLTTESGETLTLSPGHYLYVNGALVPASTVAVGDRVELASGDSARVSHVGNVLMVGLFNPQTISGDIIVDGIRASTYTTAVQPSLAHAALAPLRALYNVFGATPLSLTYGADLLASYMPSGRVVA